MSIDATQAKLDFDNIFEDAGQTITYKDYTYTEDWGYGTKSRDTPTSYTVRALCSANRNADRFDKNGLLIEGDLIGKLRYEYSEESDGTTISPIVTPAKHDRITFLSDDYEIFNLKPVTTPDGTLVAWDFEAKKVNEE